MDRETYFIGVIIGWVLGGIAIWIYAMAQWGLLLGIMFGWIPAAIGGLVIGILWPVIIAGVIVISLIMKH